METKGVLLDIYDHLAKERDAALSRIAVLERVCLEAQLFIGQNDDARNDHSADRVLKLIRDALATQEDRPMEYIATGVRWVAESFVCHFSATEQDAKAKAIKIVKGQLESDLYAEPLHNPSVRIRQLIVKCQED